MPRTRDFYDVELEYDPAPNILALTDNVHRNVSGNRNFDVLYTPDQLDSLTRAKGRRLPAEDSDGDWDATDSAAITGGYDVRKDADLDGDVDAADITQANSIAGGYQTLGYGVQSSPAVANTLGYVGYEFDLTFQGAGSHLYHVRFRVYDAGVGRWLTRDPLGYVDGMSRSIFFADPFGLFGSQLNPNGAIAVGGAATLGMQVPQAIEDTETSYDPFGLQRDDQEFCVPCKIPPKELAIPFGLFREDAEHEPDVKVPPCPAMP